MADIFLKNHYLIIKKTVLVFIHRCDKDDKYYLKLLFVTTN